MVDVAIKERPDIVCISGDIFHQEQIGPVRYSDEMIHATNIITSLAHFAGYHAIVKGEHNGELEEAFENLQRAEEHKKEMDREVLAKYSID